MELNYYRLTFENNKEFLIKSNIDRMDKVLTTLTHGSLTSSYISLQLKGGDPLYIKKDRLFSVQRVGQLTIGAQSKVWEIVK